MGELDQAANKSLIAAMSSFARKDLLDRFPVIRTRSVEELRQVYASIYASPRIELEDNGSVFAAKLNNCNLKNIGLSYANYSGALRMVLPYPNSIMQFFILHGKGEVVAEKIVTPLEPGGTKVITPTERHVLRTGANHERLGLSLKSGPLMMKLSSLIGAQINCPLRMDHLQEASSPARQSLYRLASYLAEQLSANESILPDLMLAELEQTLMVAFLCANRHNYSNLLERKPLGVASWQVRRAEDYIEANWNRAIGVEDIAAATGASARSIFRAFRESRGCSPMNFVKQLRLRQAQQMLIASGLTASVTDIAMACGFGDLGRFSKDYRAAFGEPPSKALTRAKATGLASH